MFKVTQPGLGTRSAHSLSCNSFGSELGYGEEAEHVQETEGEDGDVCMGLSSLRSEARNSRGLLSTPRLGHTPSRPLGGSGLANTSVPSAVPSPSRMA